MTIRHPKSSGQCRQFGGHRILPILTFFVALLIQTACSANLRSLDFPLGTIQSDLYRVDSLASSNCLADYRMRARQTIRNDSPEATLDSAVYFIYWGHFDQALEILDRTSANSIEVVEQPFIRFNKLIALASKAANAGFVNNVFESRICAKQALDICDTLLQWCGGDKAVWKLKAQMHRLMGDADAQVNGYWEWSKLLPKDAQLLGTLAEICYDMKQNTIADSAFRALQSIESLSGTKLATWARTQYRLQAYEECLISCNRLLAEAPERKDIFLLKGKAYYMLAQYEEAAPIFSEVVRIDSTDDWSWFRLGYSLRMLERIDESVFALRKALVIDPYWDLCYHNLARCAESKGDFEYAMVLADSAILLDPEVAENYWLLGYLQYKATLYEQSVSNYKIAINHDPTNPEIWWELSMTYRQLQRDTDMWASIDSTLKYDPNHEKALRYLGNYLLESREHRRALEFFVKLTNISPKTAEYWEKQSMLQYLTGQYEESLKSCEFALSLAPDRYGLQEQRKEILLKLGRKE